MVRTSLSNTIIVYCSLVGLLAGGCASERVDERRSMENNDLRRQPSMFEEEVRVRGGDAASMLPEPLGTPVMDEESYDVVVVGGGLGGLTSSFYLTKAGKRVLLLDKEGQLGGLAAWGNGENHSKTKHFQYGRGAAYWTESYEEEKHILDEIGFKEYEKRFEINEPIDSFYVRGKFYAGLWDEETLKSLPASFALFRYELQMADKEGLIPNQPFEDFEKYQGKMFLDGLTAKEWIEAMPESLRKRLAGLKANLVKAAAKKKNKVGVREARNELERARAIYARFARELHQKKLRGPSGMQDVIELTDLFCRSALGSTTHLINAMAFANFYISEIATRYTTDGGTGGVAKTLVTTLNQLPAEKMVMRTGAAALKIANTPNGVLVTYNHGGKTRQVRASYAVFASQFLLAPFMIESLTEKAPEQAAMMSDLMYTHYLVHIVRVEGHPYRATYDTWTYADDYTDDDFTDVILGRWMDPDMRGYLGFRDFKKDPPDDDGLISIYQPLPGKWAATRLGDDDVKALAERSLNRFDSLYSKLPNTLWRGPLKVRGIESNRWPFSVHIVRPGFFSKSARIMRRPFGRVFFGNNNLGTPAFEEALFRGHCAAINILHRMDPKATREDWSRCPIDD